ncbi:hypothetical protein HDU87_005468 [Geranomyces variabilis]|uniref:CENP-V/GFA domain-containing protein n=1 Tax=Geranomyces variabilis TaxID=109894 RepID=A0AAD5XP98_9FUNG|nr:hypothetical protein HDU87_005468 [Geranomyces variabilis]
MDSLQSCQPERQTYDGNCHCGGFKFTVTLPTVTTVNACECRMCFKHACLWLFLHNRIDLVVVRGEGTLKTFESEHEVKSFKEAAWVLKWEDKHFECASGARQQTAPSLSGSLPALDGKDLKLYYGSCHCGKVQIVLRSKPLSQVEVKEDDCSICIRVGYTLVYPSLAAVCVQGAVDLTGYRFGRKMLEHKFCSTCGVNMYIAVLGPPKEIVDTFSEARKEMVRKKLDCVCVNIRALDMDEDEWDSLKIKRERDDSDPAYVVD